MLLTGATGFLGRAIVPELRAAGYATRSFQRRGTLDGAPALTGDIRDPSVVARATQGVDAVIHAAGLAHVFRQAARSPFADINERGTDVVARAALSAGVGHFILISSVAVYGGSDNEGEEEAACRPAGPYAVSKAAAERRVTEALDGSPMRLTILRLATLYGEGDRGNVHRLMRWLERGRFVWIGRGTNHKTLLHVDDAARACVLPLEKDGERVEIYNVAAPPVTMREVVEGLARALGRPIPAWHVPAGLAIVAATAARAAMPARGRALREALTKWMSDEVYPAGRFYRRFDFAPRVRLADGLRRQVAWWRQSNGDPPAC